MTNTFYGLPIRAIENTHLRLEYLDEAGPRIVRLFLPNRDENLLAETPNVSWETPYGTYHVHGGHRLWVAPEVFPGTYLPDNEGLSVDSSDIEVRLTQPAAPASGIEKSLLIHLHPGRPAVTLRHTLTNYSESAVELAAWPITQLPLGGIGVFPQTVGPLDPSGLQPNRNLVLWPYTRWQDDRLELADDLILVHGRPATPPLKIGYLNRHGWTGYLREGVFFCKRFELPGSRSYPDFGCNVETYCHDQFFESETLGPLIRLEPGQAADHIETWELFLTDQSPVTPAGMGDFVRELGLPSSTSRLE